MDLLKKIQVLKTGPVESDKNWHAAIKWRVMTKCKRRILSKNVLGRRYLIFFVWRGVPKMCFLDLIYFYVILVPWWSGRKKWGGNSVMQQVLAGSKSSFLINGWLHLCVPNLTHLLWNDGASVSNFLSRRDTWLILPVVICLSKRLKPCMSKYKPV